MICRFFKNKGIENELGIELCFGVVIGVVIGIILNFFGTPGAFPLIILLGGIATPLLLVVIIWTEDGTEDDPIEFITTIKTNKTCIIGSIFSYSATISLFHISKINPFGWGTLVAILVFGEILFFLDRSKKPKDTTRFEFAGMRKIESIFESSIILLSFLGISYAINKIQWIKGVQTILQGIQTILQGISDLWTAYGTSFLRILGCIVLVIVVFIGIVAWIWINSFRYKEKPKKKKKKS